MGFFPVQNFFCDNFILAKCSRQNCCLFGAITLLNIGGPHHYNIGGGGGGGKGSYFIKTSVPEDSKCSNPGLLIILLHFSS